MDLEKLGKYEIVSKIGEGAMGEVYKAYDPVLGREVAVKTMSAAIGADNELRQRFHREAQSAARLNHPNIITIYDFGEEKGRAYIAMELLEGTDLNDLIAHKSPMTLEAKVALMEQMAEGLAFAHARDVVHRDLKPANIHIQRGGQVKIMDFGLARLSTSNMTRAGMVMGTPNYMSPEQVKGEKATARSDVFSLGAVFYELLTYRKPFDADSLHAVLYQVMQTEPEPLVKAVPGLPSPLREVVETAMAKDATRRYQNASELREALRAVRSALAAASTAPDLSDAPTLPRGRPATTPPAPVALGSAPAAPVSLGTPAQRSDGASLGTAVAIVSEPTRLPAAVPATIAADDPTTLAGRASTHVAPKARTRRDVPATPLPREAPAPNRLPLIGGAAAVAVVVAYVAFRVAQGPPAASPTPAAEVTPPSPSAPTVILEETTPLDPGPVLAQARRSLEARDYRTAAAKAQTLLAEAPSNADAERVLSDARAAVRRGEVAARELRAALDAGDVDRSSLALGRLVELDPRNPDISPLTLRVNEALQRKAADAQRALEQARRQPVPTPVITAAPPSAAPTAPPAATPAPATPAPATSLAPPVALTPAQMDAARKDIRGVLEEYQSAVKTKNPEYLRRLAPGLDYESMKSRFSAVAGMDVKVEIQDVKFNGESATADCLVTYTPNPKPAGKMPPVPTLFHLKKAGAVWIIEKIARK